MPMQNSGFFLCKDYFFLRVTRRRRRLVSNLFFVFFERDVLFFVFVASLFAIQPLYTLLQIKGIKPEGRALDPFGIRFAHTGPQQVAGVFIPFLLFSAR